MRAYVETRSQKSRGSGHHQFGGPDTYVAIQIVPDGVLPLAALSEAAANKRGIVIEYFGEGYSRSRGPNSKLGRALAAANERARLLNAPGAELILAIQRVRKQAAKISQKEGN